MMRPLPLLFLAGLMLGTMPARASYHTYQIDEIFSNADGTVQYVVLHESAGMNGENLLYTNHAQLINSDVNGKPTSAFPFPKNLPGGTCDYYGECTPAPTAGTRVLIATQGFVALNLVTPDYVMPNGFLTIGGGMLNYAGWDMWVYGPLPTDGVNALNRSGIAQANRATNFAGQSGSVALAAPQPNYQGLWWNSGEPGWGVNFAHQGDQIFATWYTYNTSGNPWWVSMLASRNPPGGNAYTGDIYANVGPPFNNYVGSATPTKIGTGSVAFTDVNNASFSYSVTGGGATNVVQTKPITRFDLHSGAQPTCVYSMNPNLNAATNYQDLWWVATESGWGVNFAHQGNLVFATWYTYGSDNSPLWLSALLTQQGMTNVYTGPLARTIGGRFDNYTITVLPPAQFVGTATLTVADGNHATFEYATNGNFGLPMADQIKPISRFLFAPPAGTTCQ